MNAIKNLTDVLSNSLTTTLDVEYKGYLQYVQILKRLENMPPLEFTYYDDLNVPRMLKVPPITLVPLTMLHIKRASFDYSVAVDKLDSLAETGKLEPSPALDEAKKNAKNNCNYTEYTLDSSGQYKVSSKGKTSLMPHPGGRLQREQDQCGQQEREVGCCRPQECRRGEGGKAFQRDYGGCQEEYRGY